MLLQSVITPSAEVDKGFAGSDTDAGSDLLSEDEDQPRSSAAGEVSRSLDEPGNDIEHLQGLLPQTA